MSLVRSLFYAWEKRLAFKDDPERRVLDFHWGPEFLPQFRAWRPPEDLPSTSKARSLLHEHAEHALASSEEYFAFEPVRDFEVREGRLWFASPARTGVETNDRVHADWFPVSSNGTKSTRKGPAVVVLPQWNAKERAQEGLCRLINRFGIASLKLALPYHEQRRPLDLLRADFTLSPNVGRTLQSCRQAVLDTRAAVQWLQQEGYGPLGIVGTSLGSAIAFVAFAHEPRLDAGVFNHISPYFADVVWWGISTRHVRRGLESNLDLDELRKLWLPLSPHSYYAKVKARGRPSLLIYGRYDLSFPTDLSLQLVRDFRDMAIEHEVFELPCGHYTTAKFPFNWMDGLRISRFLARNLVPCA